MTATTLEGLSLRELTAHHNALPGVTPVARFKNKPAAIARIAAAEAAQAPDPEPTKPATEHASVSADGGAAGSAADTAANPSRPSAGGVGRTNRKSRIGAVLALLEHSKGATAKEIAAAYGEPGMAEEKVRSFILGAWVGKEKGHTVIEISDGRYRVSEPVRWAGSTVR